LNWRRTIAILGSRRLLDRPWIGCAGRIHRHRQLLQVPRRRHDYFFVPEKPAMQSTKPKILAISSRACPNFEIECGIVRLLLDNPRSQKELVVRMLLGRRESGSARG
jgi:hypothetical protein